MRFQASAITLVTNLRLLIAKWTLLLVVYLAIEAVKLKDSKDYTYKSKIGITLFCQLTYSRKHEVQLVSTMGQLAAMHFKTRRLFDTHFLGFNSGEK